MINLTSSQLRRAADIKDKIVSLQKELSRLLGRAELEAEPRKRRRLSAAGRANIRAAMKARWAKVRSRKVGRKPRRKLSAAAKARLSAKMKAAWASRKAQKK